MWMWRMHKFKLLILSEGSNWVWWNCRTVKCRKQFGKEEKNDCDLDENTDKANRIYEFTAIHSFVTVITFSLNEPVYVIKVTEKGRATQMMSDMYGHRISKGELYLRGNYLKVVRS